ncbi:sulfurtransferase [Halomonas sp. PR-M31]|uniref:sulfurtransferase n=1 Tax=Halomonas sp. PR-M31 TaxID=1471202 RepID=UPI00065232F4|nr:sulfurtransferase [Halomonas sp. PR-M31]
MSVSSSSSVIEASALAEMLAFGTPLCILDCRARLDDAEAGHRSWQAGHLPGSQHLDLDRDLAASPGEQGRHPLPSESEFTATVQRLGITPDIPVILYDDMSGQMAAARAWWMLYCWAGHPDVRVLDGGLAAWQRQEGEMTQEAIEASSSDWQPIFDEGQLVSADMLLSTPNALIDARAWERFRGEVEPIDPVAGHIPGALCRPCSTNLTQEGYFKKPDVLDIELPRKESVISYCGSGVTACHNILAYAIAGRDLPRLYAGSWSHWIRDSQRPVATGDV